MSACRCCIASVREMKSAEKPGWRISWSTWRFAIREFPGHRPGQPHLCCRRRMAWIHLDRPDHLLLNRAERTSRPAIADRGRSHEPAETDRKTTCAAERGAVLAEMHMYENSPDVDADRRRKLHDRFLRTHTATTRLAGKATLKTCNTVTLSRSTNSTTSPPMPSSRSSGTSTQGEVRDRVVRFSERCQVRQPPHSPHTVEPPQNGVRRVTLRRHI